MTKCKQLGASFWLWLAVAMCLLAHPVWGEDSPDIGWQQRAVERARALSQLQWTPVADTMPSRRGGYFEKGKQYTGTPYSSVGPSDDTSASTSRCRLS